MTRRRQQFDTLLDSLRGQIQDSFAPGDALPSHRELAAMHGVGQTTIHRALKELAGELRLKSVPRGGWMKLPSERTSAKRSCITIGIMSRRSRDEWSKFEIYPALLEEGRRRGVKILELPNPHEFKMQLARHRIELARVPWNSLDVGLLVEAEDTIRLKDPRLLKHNVLAVDQDATDYGIDSVAFADAHAGALVAQHLLQLGHRHFAVMEEVNELGYPCDPSWTARRHGFEAAIGEAGALIRPQWRMQVPRRVFHHSHHHHVKVALSGWRDSAPGLRPTALFALAPAPFIQGKFFDECESYGFRVPKDLSVVAATWNGKFFGGPEPEFNGKRLTCIDFDLNALVRKTYDAAIELFEEKRQSDTERRSGRAPKLFQAPALLMPGNSTAAPAH